MHRFALRALALAALLATAALPLAAQAPEASLSSQVHRIELDNGLHIYVLPQEFSPTFAAVYRFQVGAAVEPKGKSGIAHLLEHMMFKGSRDIGTLDPKAEARLMAREAELWQALQAELDRRERPFDRADEEKIERLRSEIASLAEEHKQLIVKNEYEEIVSRAGGVWSNAMTGPDSTTYVVQLPSNMLELWFQIEASRLLHPVFREFYSERDVVAEERRQSYDNRPEALAGEKLNSLMFTAHPYGVPVIGWSSDVMNLSRADAEAYFRTFYSPGNCDMVLAGNVDPAEVEKLAKKYLGSWRPVDLPAPRVTAEPPQRGQRRAVVEFDADPSLQLGWVTVPEGHPDSYALDILGSILGGLQSSRLEESLVQGRQIASRIFAGSGSQQYGGTFEIHARPQGGHDLAEIEAGILDAIRQIQTDGVTGAELERAKVASEIHRVRRLESNIWLAFSIAHAAAVAGRVEYLEEADERLQAVTADEVKAVAAKYLQPSRMCAVEVVRPADPAGLPPGTGGPPGGEFEHGRGAPAGDRGARHSKGFERAMATIEAAPPVEIRVPEVGRDITRTVLPSGITVFLKEDHSLPAISMRLAFLGGTNTTPVEELAAGAFAAELLSLGGTAELGPRATQELKDDLGFDFGLEIGATSSTAEFWSLSRNFDESFALACDLLTAPRLDEQRLQVLKGQYVESMRRRFERPSWAVNVLENQILHGDHPRLGHQISKAEAEAVTVEDVRELMARYLGPANLFVTVVGDFEAPAMLQVLEERLGPWRRAARPEREWIRREPAVRPGVFLVERDIPQPAISLVQELAVDRTAPPEEHAALEILNEILGGSGFRSRLMERVRSDEGLTYGIYSWINHEYRPGVPGELSIGYQTRRESVVRSIDIVMDEVRRIREQGVTAAEVAEQIQAWRNAFIFKFENRVYSVARLMNHELDERAYDRDRRQLEDIEKVTPESVSAAARKYLDPERVTIAVFGSLTAEDEARLAERYGLTKLAKDEVFRGGF